LRREVTGDGEGVAGGTAGRAWAVLGLLGLSMLLVSLPALVAVGVRPPGGAVFAWLAASLAVVSGGGKLAAVIWGLASRLAGSAGLAAAAATIE
jgi:hypothetical protein